MCSNILPHYCTVGGLHQQLSHRPVDVSLKDIHWFTVEKWKRPLSFQHFFLLNIVLTGNNMHFVSGLAKYRNPMLLRSHLELKSVPDSANIVIQSQNADQVQWIELADLSTGLCGLLAGGTLARVHSLVAAIVSNPHL